MQTTDEKLIKAIYRSSPVIHFCNRFSGNSPLWDYTRHKHPYFEFIYHLSGNVRRKTDDLTVQNANIFDTILYPVDCWHQDASTDSKKEAGHYLREVICIWAAFPSIHLDRPIKVQDQNGMLEHLFFALYAESQKISPSPELLSLQIRTLFLQILILSNESSNTLVNHVIQYLNLHSKENISLEMLAEQVHVSKSYLVKQFKEKTGTTVISYLHEIRLNHVKRLLVTTTKSVEEIALETGFDSPKYLYRLFKAQEGLSPNAYRRLYLTEHDGSIIT